MNKPTTPTLTYATTPTSDLHIATHSGLSSVTGPTHEEIARRAYDIFVETGHKHGQCEKNWHQAERSLRDQGQAARHAQQQHSGAFAPHSAGGR